MSKPIYEIKEDMAIVEDEIALQQFINVYIRNKELKVCTVYDKPAIYPSLVLLNLEFADGDSNLYWINCTSVSLQKMQVAIAQFVSSL